MTDFSISVSNQEAVRALGRLRAGLKKPTPWLRAIGEALRRQVLDTFSTGTDPWGRRWLPNSEVTLAAFFARKSGSYVAFTDIASRKTKLKRVGNKKGYFLKDGSLTARAEATLSSKRPLIGTSHFLGAHSISYQVDGDGTLALGSSAVYAALQQFGGRKAEFPHLWGDVPARPFLPITAGGDLAPAAVRTIEDVVQDALFGQ